MIELFPHQQLALEKTREFQNVGYFLDMGLGKTYVAIEKMREIGNQINLVVCPRSMIETWCDALDDFPCYVLDLRDDDNLNDFIRWREMRTVSSVVGVINYDLIFRRDELKNLHDFTLILDESSLIQNQRAKRSRAVLNDLDFANVILLSGTVVNGNYEKLWSQCRLLGWNISEDLFLRNYLTFETVFEDGFYKKVKTGYKNIERLKSKLGKYGAVFMKTNEVFDLPEQTVIHCKVRTTPEYAEFKKHHIVGLEGFHGETKTFIGDTQLAERLYSRMLCSITYCPEKQQSFVDLVNSTDDRLIVFYNFDDELKTMLNLVTRPFSIVNGDIKDLDAYETESDSITFIQYQAGSMGLNLQKANKIIYVSMPDGGSELFEQSKKRIHRIGQTKPCFYYLLYCRNSIEDLSILPNLQAKKDRIDYLFE